MLRCAVAEDVAADRVVQEIAFEPLAEAIVFDSCRTGDRGVGAAISGIPGLVEVLQEVGAVLVLADPGLVVDQRRELRAVEPIGVAPFEAERPFRDARLAQARQMMAAVLVTPVVVEIAVVGEVGRGKQPEQVAGLQLGPYLLAMVGIGRGQILMRRFGVGQGVARRLQQGIARA